MQALSFPFSAHPRMLVLSVEPMASESFLAQRGQARSRRRRGRQAPGLSLLGQTNTLFRQFRSYAKLLSIMSVAAESTVLFAVRLALRLHLCVRRSAPLCPERGLHFCSRRRNGAVAGARPGRDLSPLSQPADLHVVCTD